MAAESDKAYDAGRRDIGHVIASVRLDARSCGRSGPRTGNAAYGVIERVCHPPSMIRTMRNGRR